MLCTLNCLRQLCNKNYSIIVLPTCQLKYQKFYFLFRLYTIRGNTLSITLNRVRPTIYPNITNIGIKRSGRKYTKKLSPIKLVAVPKKAINGNIHTRNAMSKLPTTVSLRKNGAATLIPSKIIAGVMARNDAIIVLFSLTSGCSPCKNFGVILFFESAACLESKRPKFQPVE